jgi:hypothetical protein
MHHCLPNVKLIPCVYGGTVLLGQEREVQFVFVVQSAVVAYNLIAIITTQKLPMISWR